MLPDSFIIRPLSANDNLKKLSLGHEDYTPLKTFLNKHAPLYERRLLCRTYVLVGENDTSTKARVWGYITLVASEVETTDANRPADTFWPESYHIPSVKIARMAVDTELRNKKWGTKMLQWALGLVNEHVANKVGCCLLITDAKKSAVSFYSKFGFSKLNSAVKDESGSTVMFIHLSKLEPEIG